MRHFIVLAGPPGTGKSTVASMLQARPADEYAFAFRIASVQEGLSGSTSAGADERCSWVVDSIGTDLHLLARARQMGALVIWIEADAVVRARAGSVDCPVPGFDAKDCDYDLINQNGASGQAGLATQVEMMIQAEAAIMAAALGVEP